jgi:predicted DNA-binding transcriptional regulator YafY
MRASRLLSILILLQLRGRVTADALAREFEVSVRTIYRDIDALSAAGVPLYGDKGPGGGFQLLDGYRTRLTGLDRDEAEAMLMISLPGPAAALGLGEATARAKGKMLASLPVTALDSAGRIASRFHLDPVDWYRAAEAAPYLPSIARAVLDQHRASMTYDSWIAKRDWEIEPLGLVLKAGAWYVVARGMGKIRVFRVSNILALEVREEAFERPPGFDLPSYWTAELERFEAGLRPHVAHLRVSATGCARLARLGVYAAAAVEEAGQADDEGWRQVTLPFETIDQAALLLLGIGPEVQILASDELRQATAVLARRMLARLEDPSEG